MNENEKYSDIIGMPRHVSGSRRHMPTSDRAKIFAPFAALKGFDGVIRAKARAFDARAEIADDMAEEIDLSLRLLDKAVTDPENKELPTASVVYFDGAAGTYRRLKAAVTDVCAVRRTLTLGGVTVGFDDIIDISYE